MNNNICVFDFWYNITEIQDKNTIINFLISHIQSTHEDSIKIPEEDSLKSMLESSIGEGQIQHNVSLQSIYHLKESTESLLQKLCFDHNFETPVTVFLLPFYPSENEKIFQGVTGIAANSSVILLFVDPLSFSSYAFQETLVHEFNHLMYYTIHHDNVDTFTVFEHCIMEGLAEHFREQTIGGDSAPWSVALEEAAAMNLVKDIEPKLDEVDESYRRDLMFGGDRFHRWSGYSIGYWFVSKALKYYPNLTWQELIAKKRSFYMQL